MSKITLAPNASGTGTFSIASPNSNTDRTLTLPDETGTILTTTTAGIPINGPAFSAYASAAQTVTLGTATKVAIDTEDFDTNSCFDTSLYRFTPTVAGYYQVNGLFRGSVATTYTSIVATIYKNGSVLSRTQINSTLTAGVSTHIAVSSVVYMNGTTDYLELYGSVNGTGTATFTYTNATATSTFSAALVRAA